MLSMLGDPLPESLSGVALQGEESVVLAELRALKA